MIPSNLNQSSLPLKKRNQDQSHLPTSTPATNTSYPRPVFLETSFEDQGADCREPHGHHYHQQQQQEKSHEFVPIDGSSEFLQSFSTNNDDNNDRTDPYVCDGYHHHEDGNGSVRWMSSKMRWMRKMVAWEQTVTSKQRSSMENLQDRTQQNRHSNSNFPGGTIRVCSDCSTTKTPLWRSGPQGPKSLCNACGIRQRKARQAMAAAGSGLVAISKAQKEKRTDRDRPIPNKKQCKINTTRTAQKKLQIDDIMMSLSNNSAFHRVFPQDEKDAAILLMALSCGLIHG